MPLIQQPSSQSRKAWYDSESSAHLERLLLRFPCSIRLKRKLQEARAREAHLAAAQARALRGRILRALASADLPLLQHLVTELEQGVDHVSH